MKFQILFPGENKKNISVCYLLKISPRVLRVNGVITSRTRWTIKDLLGFRLSPKIAFMVIFWQPTYPKVYEISQVPKLLTYLFQTSFLESLSKLSTISLLGQTGLNKQCVQDQGRTRTMVKMKPGKINIRIWWYLNRFENNIMIKSQFYVEAQDSWLPPAEPMSKNEASDQGLPCLSLIHLQKY